MFDAMAFHADRLGEFGALPVKAVPGSADQAIIEDAVDGAAKKAVTLQGIADLAKGYSLYVQALSSSPVDGQTIYFGILPTAPTVTAATRKIYIRRAGTIRIAEIYCHSGTAGTNENWSLYLRRNNAADILIATVGVATNERVFSNTALNIPMTVGEYFEIKAVNPTWATNPVTTVFGGFIYLE
jgi:hypothetical protein